MNKTLLLLTPLLLVVGLQANSKKIASQEEKTFAEGTTEGHYQKPGAPINMSYHSVKVNANEKAEVNITLTTTAKSGTLFASMTHDENLTILNNAEKDMKFEVAPNRKTFNINLQVSSKIDGLYYIRLLTKIDRGYGLKLRSFAIPVYIGENQKPKKTAGVTLMKAKSGENISISKAVETVEVIHDK